MPLVYLSSLSHAALQSAILYLHVALETLTFSKRRLCAYILPTTCFILFNNFFFFLYYNTSSPPSLFFSKRRLYAYVLPTKCFIFFNNFFIFLYYNTPTPLSHFSRCRCSWKQRVLSHHPTLPSGYLSLSDDVPRHVKHNLKRFSFYHVWWPLLKWICTLTLSSRY